MARSCGMALPKELEPRRALRGASPRALPFGLLLALALHGSAVGVAALSVRALLPASAALRAAPAEPLTWLDAELEPPPAPAALPEPAADEPEPASAAPSAAPAAPPRLAALRRSASGAAHIPGSGEDGASNDVGGDPAASEATAEGEGEPAAAAPAPSLSLEALGVGQKNPFLTPPRALTAAEQRAALGRHIDHVLRDGLAQRDQELGLGPEGPAVAKVTELVMQSTTRPNTNALLSLRTDGKGEVVHVEVAEASGDTDGWNTVAADLLRSLRGKRLRVPTGTGGVTMQLRVDSRVQLPSGADPGLAVDVMGLPLKKGEGERSTRIQLLQPKIVLETVQLTDDPNSKIPVLGLSLTIIAVMGDPVDIGAPARRVVHTHLVSLKTHPLAPPEEATR